VRERSYAFALPIVQLTQRLREQKEFELAGQVLRAGTSIGANVEEALAGISTSHPHRYREDLSIDRQFKIRNLKLKII
jgi:four helix bundle protein